jgi:serine-type D-Ala-D-Ala carboxypeptidase/endopeptidase (penicillin-binding protein 4)
MHRLAISMVCSALVFGLATASAETPPTKTRTAAPDTPSDQGKSGKAAHTVRAPAPDAKKAPHKPSSARARLPALRERRLQTLGRERQPSTAEDLLIKEIESIWSSRELRRGTTAVYVVDAATGRPLYAAHEDERLNPASNVKLIATATILDTLGPDWRYLTRILGPTPTPQGVIRGDLYLLGSHDPTLDSHGIEAMAAQIAAAGVTRIEGDIHVGEDMPGDGMHRDSVRWPRVTIRVKGASEPGRAPEIAVHPDTPFVRVESRVETIKPARGKARAGVALETQVIEDPELGTYWRVALTGYVQTGRSATYRHLAPHGQLFTAHLLHRALNDAGVTVTGSPRQAALPDYVARATSYLPVEIARHESAPMRELVARINKRSVNDLADRAIMTAGAIRYGGLPTMEKGVRAMHAWLRDNTAIDPDNVVLDTGSGLSYKTQLTARQIVKVLRAASGYSGAAQESNMLAALADSELEEPVMIASQDTATPGHAHDEVTSPDQKGDEHRAGDADTLDPLEGSEDPGPGADSHADEGADEPRGDDALDERSSWLEHVFRASLAVGGVDGTLRGRFRGKTRGKVVGKTGTLTRVIALSGLVEDDEGSTLAFAIITNGHQQNRRNKVRDRHEAMVAAMQRYLRARAAARD